MIRTQIQLTEEQSREIKSIAEREDVSVEDVSGEIALWQNSSAALWMTGSRDTETRYLRRRKSELSPSSAGIAAD